MGKIELKEICKIYGDDDVAVHALDHASFSIEPGEFVVVLGASGAGKSTLLNIMGGMDVATSGKFLLDDEDVCTFDEKRLSLYRRNDVGFVFQFYNLMPNLTALENVEIAGSLVASSMNAADALDAVGLKSRANNFPSQLSGGEQQRVAIARAIVKQPKLLLCDEPTGALDSKTGTTIIKLLYKIARDLQTTVIIVTHNAKLAAIATHLIRVSDGKIIEDNRQPLQESLDDVAW